MRNRKWLPRAQARSDLREQAEKMVRPRTQRAGTCARLRPDSTPRFFFSTPSRCAHARCVCARVQAGESPASGGGTLTKRPGSAGSARPAGTGGTVARRGTAARKPTSSGRPAGGGQGAGILRFYTDDAPGLKMCALACFFFHDSLCWDATAACPAGTGLARERPTTDARYLFALLAAARRPCSC